MGGAELAASSTSHTDRVAPWVSLVPRVAFELARTGDGPQHRRLPGSMVFVDISGFTAMSERLARFGKVGAEEVTDVLDLAFTELLEVAYELGGTLLKFGGDALLLFFPGDDHVVRAARAAHGMRAKLRDLGGLDSSAGKVHLRMSVGVHTGDFDFFLVGTSHRDLLVTGPAASRTVEMEGTADAGEIVVSPEVRAALPHDVVGGAKGEGFLLRRAPDHEMPPVVHGGKEPSDGDDQLVPRALRSHLQDGIVDSEHRPAVIAFVHVDGVDRLVEEGGPEAATPVLHELASIIQRAADAHDVSYLASDVDIDGGKFILGAGVPAFHADDDERMLRTLRSIVESDPPLPLKLGVNRGPVFAGVVGPPYRLTYTVMGDTVNLAARVMARAGHGQIVATPAVLERSRARFDTTDLEPFAAKGKAELVRAATVGPLQAGGHVGGRAPQVQLPLVGRDDELETLTALWRQATEGDGAVAELVGPAGIGKSRLSYELRDRISGARKLMVSCDQYEATTPYHAFRSLIRQVLGADDGESVEQQIETARRQVARSGSDLEPWFPLVALVAGFDVPQTEAVEELDPKFRPVRLREVLADLLVRRLAGPTLVQIEDAHWLDEASRELLRHLASVVVPEAPWLVVLNAREPGTAGEDATTIELAPLDAGSAQELAHRAAQDGLLELSQVDAVLARAEGHPLFLQELIQHGAGGGHLPDSIESLIGSRIDQLAPRPRTLLRQAALLGRRFDVSLLSAISGERIDDRTVRELDEFVAPMGDGQFEFTHALYRDTAYEALTYRKRRELHDRAGRVIETRHLGRTDEVAAILALHYYRAGRHERAWQLNRTAARRARDQFATSDALRFYRWAIESGSRVDGIDPGEIGELHHEMGDLLELLGSYDEAEHAYRSARRHASAERLPELLYKQGIVRERTASFTAAIRWYRRARRALAELPDRSGDDLDRLVLLREAEIRLRQGRRRDARRIAADVLDGLPDQPDPTVAARTHFVLAWALRGDGQSDAHRRAALDRYSEVGDLSGQGIIWMQSGNDAYFEGRWEDALHDWERAGELKQRIGDRVATAISLNNRGEVLSDRARFDAAQEAFDSAHRVFTAAGFRLGVGVVDHNLGRLHARRGQLELATEELERALALFTELGSTSYELETTARVAELLLFASDLDASRATAQRVLDRSGDAEPGTICLAARVLAAGLLTTDPARAVALLEDVRDRVDASEARFERACVDLVLSDALGLTEARTRAANLRVDAHETLEGLGVLTEGRVLISGPLAAAY